MILALSILRSCLEDNVKALWKLSTALLRFELCWLAFHHHIPVPAISLISFLSISRTYPSVWHIHTYGVPLIWNILPLTFANPNASNNLRTSSNPISSLKSPLMTSALIVSFLWILTMLSYYQPLAYTLLFIISSFTYLRFISLTRLWFYDVLVCSLNI